MIRYVLLAVIASCIWIDEACSQSIVALEIGPSFFTNGSEYRNRNVTYELDTSSLNMGVLVPIRIPKFDSHIRLAVTLGDGHDVSTPQDVRYVAIRNEVLVGRRMRLGAPRLHVLPQLGVGLLIEGVYEEWPHGVGYSSGYVDLATTLGYSFDGFGLGAMFTFEKAFWESGKDADGRVGISAVLWK